MLNLSISKTIKIKKIYALISIHTIKIYDSNVFKDENNTYYTTGGRVLSMVSIDNTMQQALENIYNNNAFIFIIHLSYYL